MGFIIKREAVGEKGHAELLEYYRTVEGQMEVGSHRIQIADGFLDNGAVSFTLPEAVRLRDALNSLLMDYEAGDYSE